MTKKHNDYLYTFKFNDQYYIEEYSYGIMNNLSAAYFTDSINFRIYMGHFDDESELLYPIINKDSLIIVKKGYKKGYYYGQENMEIKERKVYSFTDLKHKHVFQ
jgi:hypothetical protein